ncbi:MAG TPA: S9 family peptidase [Nitrososphaerales archaeon]|nr:S9 family peptidase [Nitrososphaerales archaeon]
MSAKKAADYGSWKSPIGGRVLASGSAQPSELALVGDRLYWLQLVPEEGGRYALYSWAEGERVHEVVPKEFNVRTRVHEYGGASYAADGRTVFFSNFSDQLVYKTSPGGGCAPISEEGLRYADFVADRKRNRLIGVREDHTAGSRLPVNTISSLGIDGSGSDVLVSGNDFYSSPRIDPSGSRIAWITWNFPNMPWDGTELWTGAIDPDGSIADRRLVCGGTAESVIMPQWSPEGVLHFVSDRTGYWNIYRWNEGRAENICPMRAEIGGPLWVFGLSDYAFLSKERIVAAFTSGGTWHLGTIDEASKRLRKVKLPFTEIGYVCASGDEVFFIGGSPTEPASVVRLDVEKGTTRKIHTPKVARVDPGYISEPKQVQFNTAGRKRAYALLYLPKNRDFTAPRGSKPPLLVVSHGGPTSQTRTSLSLLIQAWTSRGFAVLDVNYGGSTGYGREYRERLSGRWGIVDVDDCCNGALSLVRKGVVDGSRLAIRGGSAGGYTTLCALAFRKTFAAGASYFGVSDAEGLAKDTHKFESRYLDRLIAPYPEGRQVYRDRSALYHPDGISVPVIFFQGLEDRVVPPSQAESMVASLRKRGVPVAYVPFEGEQHGFRRAASIVRAFEAELYFYSRVFGFSLPGRTEAVEIWNLPKER